MLVEFKVSAIVAILPLVFVAGCPNNTTGDPPDARADAAASPPDATAPPVGGNSLLGAACWSANDCASGFCIDGVCCDSACGQTCYACNQPAATGHCAALTTGEDSNAAPACIAPSACSLPTTSSVPACKLVDGTTCQADGDCISGHCLTYYVDADGDGYGTSEEAHFCEELNAEPPAGYAAYTGDCCDLDSGANPGFDSTQFLEMPDACGSYDWNCNGVIAQQKTCSTAVACGAQCTFMFFGSAIPLFTEACN